MKKSVLFSILVIVLLIPATLYLGSRLSGHWYYLTSTLIIVVLSMPFVSLKSANCSIMLGVASFFAIFGFYVVFVFISGLALK